MFAMCRSAPPAIRFSASSCGENRRSEIIFQGRESAEYCPSVLCTEYLFPGTTDADDSQKLAFPDNSLVTQMALRGPNNAEFSADISDKFNIVYKRFTDDMISRQWAKVRRKIRQVDIEVRPQYLSF